MKLQTAGLLALLAASFLAAQGGAAAGEKLDASERRKLDTFFSNFSEARVEGFAPGDLSDQALLDFALAHNCINNFKALTLSTRPRRLGRSRGRTRKRWGGSLP